ncbi:hypothetical protein B0H11DRAFT_202925 [Mycena galericulata]|nr:hypothetical protein B0H11DRAFT_202925 [Mycena galericulata]
MSRPCLPPRIPAHTRVTSSATSDPSAYTPPSQAPNPRLTTSAARRRCMRRTSPLPSRTPPTPPPRAERLRDHRRPTRPWRRAGPPPRAQHPPHHPVHLSPPPPAFERLTFENTPGGAQEAATAITAALRVNTDFGRLVMSYCDALPSTFSTLDDVLDSVSVAPLELPAPRVVWRVYMRVTTHIADGYNAIRRAFRDVVFVMPFNNTGYVRGVMSCRICRAIDHPTLLCPFPDTPGWMGLQTPRSGSCWGRGG